MEFTIVRESIPRHEMYWRKERGSVTLTKHIHYVLRGSWLPPISLSDGGHSKCLHRRYPVLETHTPYENAMLDDGDGPIGKFSVWAIRNWTHRKIVILTSSNNFLIGPSFSGNTCISSKHLHFWHIYIVLCRSIRQIWIIIKYMVDYMIITANLHPWQVRTVPYNERSFLSTAVMYDIISMTDSQACTSDMRSNSLFIHRHNMWLEI